MQFRITFQVLRPGQLLPLSYQYELSAWIYSRIHHANSEFAKFLHSQGYGVEHKRFKFFTFSNLWIPPRYKIIDDRIQVWSREISFVVSFLVPQAAVELITGLFKEQEFALGDKISRIELRTQAIDVLKPFENKASTIQLRSTSPILLSRPKRHDNGKLRHDYLAPADTGYAVRFINNLRHKHEIAVEHKLAEPLAKRYEIHFNCLSPKPKSRLIRIKSQQAAETRLRGYLYDFELTAPQELIRVGRLAGFGEENALGFGATREGRRDEGLRTGKEGM